MGQAAFGRRPPLAGHLINGQLEALISVLGLSEPSDAHQCSSYISSSHVDRTYRKRQEAQKNGTQLATNADGGARLVRVVALDAR